jgi:hypothetical protein
MAKATEDKLGALHGAIATALTEIVETQEEVMAFDQEGGEVGTGVMAYSASPAMFATAVKFLKDNSITCDIRQEENMNNLKEALARKQKHSRLNNPREAATELHAVN